jgi:hypothetical protein
MLFDCLGIASSLDGERLLLALQHVETLFPLQMPLRLADASSSSSSFSSQQQSKYFTFAMALLDSAERAKDLDDEMWSLVAQCACVPCVVEQTTVGLLPASTHKVSNLAAGDTTTIATIVAHSATAAPVTGTTSLVVLRKPSLTLMGSKFLLCPLSGKRPIVAYDPSSSSSSRSANYYHHDSKNEEESQMEVLRRWPKLTERFQWNQPPPVKDVLYFINWAAELEHLERGRDGHPTLEHFDHATVLQKAHDIRRIGAGIHAAYSYLNSKLRSEPDLFTEVRKSIRGLYIPEMEHAYSVNRLSTNSAANQVSPYLATIDKTFENSVPHLMRCLGIKEKHLAGEMNNILEEIIEDFAVKERPSHDGQPSTALASGKGAQSSSAAVSTAHVPILKMEGMWLSGEGLLLYIRALEYMVTQDGEGARQIAQGGGSAILVPTVHGRLRDARRVSYDFFCDQRSLHAQAKEKQPHEPEGGDTGAAPANLTESSSTTTIPATSRDSGEDDSVLHERVSSEVAKKLGMKHVGSVMISRLVANQTRRGNRSKNDNHLANDNNFTARGQRQSVPNSIKRILGDYSDPQSLLMELLQNADDAGAHEVKFWLDTRQFEGPAEGLLGPGMKDCLGPSLVAYNNKQFSDADFDALLEIGCGHKSHDQLAIGTVWCRV